MPLTVVDVCNAALGRLGAATISALNDGSVEAVQCTASVDITRRALLRMHPWKFAKKYANLTPPALTSGSLVVGTQYVIKSNTGSLDVTNVGAANNNNGTTFIATGTTPTSWGTGTLYASPPFDYTYQVNTPSDCLRIIKVNLGYEEYKKVGVQIYCNTDTVQMEYLYDCSDFAVMDSQFFDVLATYLAVKMCVKLTNSSNLQTELDKEFTSMLAKARFSDSVEDTPDSIEPQEWLQSRTAPPSGFVRNPNTGA